MDFLITHADAALWLVLIVLFLVAEAATAVLISVWFAAGALAAMIIALLGLPIWLQILVFLAVSGVVLLLTKPLTEKMVNQKTVKTNADRVIGALGRATADIDNLAATGFAEVAGHVWPARSHSGEPLPKDSIVRVVEIEGVKLLVEPADKN